MRITLTLALNDAPQRKRAEDLDQAARLITKWLKTLTPRRGRHARMQIYVEVYDETHASSPDVH
jgi:hypothetical protein